MEKFALLDFLKAFESLTGKRTDTPAFDGEQKNEVPRQTAPAPEALPDYTSNPMADLLARHEEISNRIKNKRSV